MKANFFHADKFGFSHVSASDRIGGHSPEEVAENGDLLVEECLVALFHVEEGDGSHQIRRLTKDVRKVAERVGATRLVVAAFGHLSHSYAAPDVAMGISREIVEICRAWEGFEVFTSPFGHNKTLVLHCKGHPDAIKHRSY